MRSYLNVYRCKNHPDVFALMLDDGYDGGVRLSSQKCCGAWDFVKGFPLTREWQEAIADVEIPDDDS